MNRQKFLVTIHDVCPNFQKSIAEILQQLQPLVGKSISAAVVPDWHNTNPLSPESEFIDFVKAHFDEIVVHGYSHLREQGTGFVSLLTNWSDEFNGLCTLEIHQRLQKSQQILSNCFNTAISGFIAPAWQKGKIDSHILQQHKINYCIGMTKVEYKDKSVPIVSWSWDAGRIAFLGYMGELLAYLQSCYYQNAFACIVLHPADVQRKYIPRAKTLIAKLLEQGLEPVLFDDLLL